jgi:transketolase
VHEGEAPSTLAVAYGPVMLSELVRAVASDPVLARTTRVVDLPWLNVIDDAWFSEALAGMTRLAVVDDHEVRNGLGVRLAARVATLGLSVDVRLRGVDGRPECGAPAEVLAHHGLDAASLAAWLAD